MKIRPGKIDPSSDEKAFTAKRWECVIYVNRLASMRADNSSDGTYPVKIRSNFSILRRRDRISRTFQPGLRIS